MGLAELIIAMKKRRQQIQADSKPANPISGTSIASVAKRTKPSCEQDDYSQDTKIMRYSGPDLPEDIWCHIHALLPLPDAARAGCVSHEFLRSWRCRPNLTFSQETLGVKLTLSEKIHGTDTQAWKFTEIVDQIMKKHAGIGVKTFELEYCGSRIYTRHLKSWLQIAVNPGLEELILLLPVVRNAKCYNFPCSLLFNGSGKSISYLNLKGCAFHPMAGLGCLRKLHLSQVDITGDELECLLSNSFVLEELDLRKCNKITCLKIPVVLNQFTDLTVSECKTLEVIENKAPSLCTVCIDGALARLPFGDSLQVKNLEISWSFERNTVHYACTGLPWVMPNLETLGVSSAGEVFNTPVVPIKFVHLKLLEICFCIAEVGAFSPTYDYLSLAFLLDACPVLETFNLSVCQTSMKHDPVSGDGSLLRKLPGGRHASIKNVKIDGFCSAESMIELTCHILDNATSLENLKLDPIYDADYEHVDRLAVHEIDDCSPPTGKRMIREAHKAVLAIEKYIVGKVPSTVKLNIRKPCSQCHSLK
uniref:F-box protein n=1 Tax=Hordeum bulbosum TaxID=4516 RepID=C6L7Y7_HORBU|nr:F-box protein [Hordeum bulbosum]